MLRILVVDDDEPTRMICQRFFRRAQNVEVVEAASGEEAIDALHGRRFDCVLSDYRMGIATGIDVLVRAMEEAPDARRVLMSGFADQTIVEEARRRAGIHAFIEKPLSMPEFDALLAREVLAPLQAA